MIITAYSVQEFMKGLIRKEIKKRGVIITIIM